MLFGRFGMVRPSIGKIHLRFQQGLHHLEVGDKQYIECLLQLSSQRG